MRPCIGDEVGPRSRCHIVRVALECALPLRTSLRSFHTFFFSSSSQMLLGVSPQFHFSGQEDFCSHSTLQRLTTSPRPRDNDDNNFSLTAFDSRPLSYRLRAIKPQTNIDFLCDCTASYKRGMHRLRSILSCRSGFGFRVWV